MTLNKFLMTTASAAIILSTPAFAQEEAAAEAPTRESALERVLGTVTVTATKKADVEDVQTVPVAMTAYNADTLDALNVTTLESLSYSSPNVSLDDVGTARGTANFAIRGLGVNSSIPSIDPAVGVFVDGVYLGVNSGVVVDMFDLDSIEVLRGPQGLLFGRNTTGGAIVVNTANPTDEFSFKARTSIDGPVDGDRGGANANFQAIVSGPLIENVLNGKFGVSYNTDDGYFKNLHNGENHGELQSVTYRGALEFMPTDALTFLGKLEYTDARSDGPSGKNTAYFDRDNFDMSINNPGFGENETILGSLRTDLDVDFGNGVITNIFGYRKYESTSGADIDATPMTLFHSNAEFNQEQYSNELRYAGTFDKLDLTTGLYYFEQTLDYTEIRNLPTTRPPTLPASIPWGFYGGGTLDHTVWGAFANIDYSITDKLVANVGVRYSVEEKSGDVIYIRPRLPCSVVEGTCSATGNNALISLITGGTVQEPNGFRDSNEWKNWTPKVGFQYFWNDNVQSYAHYTKGFRSGGYNFRITDLPIFQQFVTQTGSLGFDEEEVDSYEVGFKSQSDDGRIQVNGAVFMTEVGNMQREVNTAGSSGVVQNIINTTDATIVGIEFDGRIALTDTLLGSFNVGFMDAGYDKVFFDLNADGVVDREDLNLDLPRVPPMTYGFGLMKDINLGSAGAIIARASYQHRDRIAYTDSNFGWIQDADMVDVDITWETPFQGLTASLYGKNLLDEVQIGNDTQLPFPGPNSTGQNYSYPVDPAGGTFQPLKKGRLLGLELTYVY
ncbi:TonB-dependent receptor [Hyphomonas sp. WL0036]|uniref:TonB-dependent receptor n=1 Tax=Hyphomonas sediminis TaxID=2866160 RepID=UPI001C81FE76|nr:TonB-dependent receptor [Hyphomonas sediminis]MBY9066199.1 TonB-dependent receptor [Hyphomonas sediminis]